jgi:hypothetical protein
LRASVGAELLAHLPEGARKIKILTIQKHRRAFSVDDGNGSAELIHKNPASHTYDSPRREGNRTIEIQVTQGMINQNLLTLTDHVHRGIVRIGEEFTVESEPSGEVFKTELLENGNKFRERGAIARFYEAAHVHAGDCITLAETSPRRWKLRKVGSIGARDQRTLF